MKTFLHQFLDETRIFVLLMNFASDFKLKVIHGRNISKVLFDQPFINDSIDVLYRTTNPVNRIKLIFLLKLGSYHRGDGKRVSP